MIPDPIVNKRTLQITSESITLTTNVDPKRQDEKSGSEKVDRDHSRSEKEHPQRKKRQRSRERSQCDRHGKSHRDSPARKRSSSPKKRTSSHRRRSRSPTKSRSEEAMSSKIRTMEAHIEQMQTSMEHYQRTLNIVKSDTDKNRQSVVNVISTSNDLQMSQTYLAKHSEIRQSLESAGVEPHQLIPLVYPSIIVSANACIPLVNGAAFVFAICKTFGVYNITFIHHHQMTTTRNLMLQNFRGHIEFLAKTEGTKVEIKCVSEDALTKRKCHCCNVSVGSVEWGHRYAADLTKNHDTHYRMHPRRDVSKDQWGPDSPSSVTITSQSGKEYVYIVADRATDPIQQQVSNITSVTFHREYLAPYAIKVKTNGNVDEFKRFTPRELVDMAVASTMLLLPKPENLALTSLGVNAILGPETPADPNIAIADDDF